MGTATTDRVAADFYDAKNFDAANSIGALVNRVRIKLVDALDAELASLDISSAQYVILMQLASGGQKSASDLCRGISYDPGAMTRMLDRLERRGLIRRVPNPNDRRASLLELTSEGKAVYPKLRAYAVSVNNRALRGFTKAEAKQLEALLTRILNAE
jgi:DNA-binding MarR family transcriptional regulator